MRYHEILAETDDYILRRYLRGKCFPFAVALRRRIKKPLYGLFDASGDLHHVFLADPVTGKAYDIRGIVDLNDVGKGSAAEEEAVEPRQITRAEAEAVYGPPSRPDVIEAGKIIDRMLWKWRHKDKKQNISEIDIGGEVDSGELDSVQIDHDFTPKQHVLFPDIPAEPTLPKTMELVGRIGSYYVTRKKERDGYIYYLFDSGNPVAYIGTIHPDADFGGGYRGRSATNPDLDGTGLRVVSIYLDHNVRGKGLSVALYYWLLNNVCDYILPDDLQTKGGVYIWRRLLRDPRFEVMIYNPETSDYYHPKPGAVWANVYRSHKLRPFVTLTGHAEALLANS